MKSIISAIALSVAIMTSASAADLPARTYTKAPVLAPPVASWTGWYIGGQGGGGDGVGNHSIIVDGTGFLNAPFGPTKISGGHYGGVVGYDWQFAPNWVVGVNTEFNGSDLKGVFDNGDLGGDYYGSEVKWFGSTRAKLGFVLPTYSQFMIYGHVGVAYANIHAENGDTIFVGSTPFLNCANNCGIGSTTKVGYTVGAGASWMIPSTRFVLSGEYGYYDFGNARIDTISARGDPHIFDVKTHFNIGRAVLSYKF